MIEENSIKYWDKFNFIKKGLGIDAPSLEDVIKEPTERVDAILVHAAGRNLNAMNRAEEAQKAIKEGKVKDKGIILLSGGWENYGKFLSNCFNMYVKIKDNKLDNYSIMYEKESEDSIENIRNSNKILEANNVNSLMVVSSASHIPRLRLIYKKELPNMKVYYRAAPQKEDFKTITYELISTIIHDKFPKLSKPILEVAANKKGERYLLNK